jgi:uncharacterized LabA/DUF88 family protein
MSDSNAGEEPTPQRVITYIDGFNLYFGLKDSGFQRYYWLNLQELARNLVPPRGELVYTKYFTTRVVAPADKRERQAHYIEALEMLNDFAIYYGKYQFATRTCFQCGYQEKVPNEKMTDVNIAVEMLSDAFQDRFDVAMLVSGDSDLTGPVAAIRRLFPDKRVTIAFPPTRHSQELENAASGSFVIGRAKFSKSQLPDQIRKPNGYLLKRPARWK